MQTKTIILIHGLWVNGLEMAWLRRQLRKQGYEPIQFSYRMLSRGLDFNMDRLREVIRQQPGPVHIVGHSLGGVLALQTLHKYPDLDVARVVCLGSPLRDSHAGRNLARFGLGRFMLGKTLPEGVLKRPLKDWQGRQQVGSIAGNLGVGMGHVIANLQKPNDGMVEEHETKLPGISDSVLLAATHTSMLISHGVVGQVDHFLRHGHFDQQYSAARADAEPNQDTAPS